MAAQRLDKIIASTGRWSRREVKELVRQGRVTVNGAAARSAEEKTDPETAEITVNGEALPWRQYTWVMLNKPAGYLSATEDGRGATVLDLLPQELQRQHLFPVGRLDKDTEGLLLLTNDGALTHRLLHPSHEVSKEYRVTVSGPVEHAAERLSRVRDVVGLPIRPAEVRELSRKGNRAELSVIIHEGRNRQIRRMCAQCELEVLRLQRVREHCLELGALPLGQWRYLTAEEIAGLKEE